MSDEERDKKIDQLLDIIKHSPAMNGGFSKLSDAVDEIRESNTKVLYELQIVKTNQDIHIEKVDDLHQALYDPDKGLYKRVAAALQDNKVQTAAIDLINRKAHKLEEGNNQLLDRVAAIENNNNVLKSIAGENLEELRLTINTRKNMLRMFWIFATAAIAGVFKMIWDIII